MDVQGAELDVLKGFKNYINTTRFIYTEYSKTELYEDSPNKEQILNLLGNNCT